MNAGANHGPRDHARWQDQVMPIVPDASLLCESVAGSPLEISDVG